MKIPQFVVPAPIGHLTSRLPQMPPTLVLVIALNLALDRVLPREHLDPLVGKRLAITVSDAGLRLSFAFTSEGFKVSPSQLEPDLAISATARDFLALLLREEDPDTLFFGRRLLMEGDTDLGLLVKNTLDSIELPDFAQLSPARIIGHVFKPTLF